MKIKCFTFSIILLLSACKQVDQLTRFHIRYDESFTIPSTTGTDVPFDIPVPDIGTNSESSFSINDTRKDKIEEVQLTSLQFTIASPADGDFGFLEEVNVFISAEGLPELLVAWKDHISDTVGNSLWLETTDANLKEYIKKDTFDLRFNTVMDELISEDHQIDMHAVFFVDAKILGL